MAVSCLKYINCRINLRFDLLLFWQK